MVICLERGANELHMVQLMPLTPRHLLLQQNPEWFILLVPAYPVCPGKRPLNGCVSTVSNFCVKEEIVVGYYAANCHLVSVTVCN